MHTVMHACTIMCVVHMCACVRLACMYLCVRMCVHILCACFVCMCTYVRMCVYACAFAYLCLRACMRLFVMFSLVVNLTIFMHSLPYVLLLSGSIMSLDPVLTFCLLTLFCTSLHAKPGEHFIKIKGLRDLYFKQTLDHFSHIDDEKNNTFLQRYVCDPAQWKQGGPIFFYGKS